MPKMAQNGPKWPKLGPNTLYSRISGLKVSQPNVQSDTDYPENISKKSKIFNMPKMAQNGPKSPELGPNTFYFCIFGLKMSQLYVKSDTDYPEKSFEKSKTVNMPKKAPNGPK